MEIKDLVIRQINKRTLKKYFQRALRYALISLPWTINRMNYQQDKSGLEKRIRNIILGKMPEYMVVDILSEFNIKTEPWAGETEYWKKDKFDLLVFLNGRKEEWDIKCLTLNFDNLKKNDLPNLPAFIPNRHKNDQWAQRNKLFLKDTYCKRYLFCYLENPGININLTEKQFAAYNEINTNRQMYRHQADMILRKLGSVKFSLKEQVKIIISGIAGPDEWIIFKPVPAGTVFLNGLIKTRIENMGIILKHLPYRSF